VKTFYPPREDRVKLPGKGFSILAGATALAVVVVTAIAAGTAGARELDERPALAAKADVLAPVLLSRNKPVVASSSGGCCAPANAVDGNSGTRWASGAGRDPQWIHVDLGATASISRVRLQWDASCARAYRVETSPDRTTWTSIYSTSTGDGGVDDLTVTGSGRYVRVFGTTRCRPEPSKGYSLQEFDVYGEIGEGQAPTPPGTPELVSVTSASATIKWAASTDSDGTVVAYDIYRDGQNCATVNGTTLTASCGNLSPNQTYGFYVNARDNSGNVSQPSETLQVTTPGTGDTEKPTAPTNLRTASPPSSTSVTLTWNAATDNVGVTGYNVYDGTAKVATSSTTTTTISGLPPGSAHSFTATAFDANGNEGPRSNTLNIILPGGGCTEPICSVDQVGTDNDVVWGLVTLPDGSILFNRRDAHNIARLVPSTGAKTIVGSVPNAQSTNGEGGLTGLAISPNFASDRWLYIMHTSPSDNRIVRMKLKTDNTLDPASHQVLVTGIGRNKFHNGGRLAWGPDNKLYAGTGDAQNGSSAQNRNSLNGKVLRINPDGSVPSDNPFGNHVWSMGHRNIQGLAFDSQGRLWQQEFGNSIMDETNLIQKGGNYGWPSCEGTSGSCGGFIAPKATVSVSSGSCSGIAIVRDNLYVACQRGTRLYRYTISGSSLTNRMQFFQGTYGRLRTVEPSPAGGLWLATSNGGDKDSTPNNSNNRIFHLTLGS
jgi:glucose/arabinose dehydrogenase